MAFWKNDGNLHKNAGSGFYTVSGESLFNTLFSLFDIGSESSDPFLISDDSIDSNVDETMTAGSQTDGRPRPLSSFGRGSGLDIDMDGAAEINLSLFDPVTGDLNLDLVTLYALLFAVAIALAMFLRSWKRLHNAMRICSRNSGLVDGHLLVPIMVEHNGRLVRGHVYIPTGDEEGGGRNHEEYTMMSKGSKGEGLYFYQPPAVAEVHAVGEAHPQEVSAVIHASDYVAGGEQPIEAPLLFSRR